MFKTALYLYAILNPQGYISEIGGKSLAEAEIDSETLVGQKFSDLIFWQNSELNSQNMANSIKLASEGSPLDLETNLRVSANKIATVKINFVPVVNIVNEVKEIIVSAIDVSEYTKEIIFNKRRSERFLFAAESAEIGLWYWDLKTNEIFSTPRCNELYGFSPSAIMTFDKFTEIVYPDDLASVKEALNYSQQNLTDYRVEYRVVLEKSGIHWVSVRGKTFQEDADSLVMMGSVRDITHRKLADERLQKLLVAEKNARDEIEEANQAKDHFLALVSHELRSPLNSILGWTKILLSKEIDQDAQKKALETIEKSAKFQAKLISDLVDSTKIISGKLNFTFHPVSLQNLILSIYESQKPLAEENKVNLIMEEIDDVSITGDAARIQQVFINLITNAIKFTPPNGDIFIRLKSENNQALFTIKDSGNGIPADELNNIFKPYYQVKNSSNKSGLGLGLSIVKAIVEKHLGQVYVENNSNGKGCTFSVELPIAKASQMAEETSESNLSQKTTNPLENIKILLVEDNDDSREVLEFYLSQLGAIVVSASSAKDGLVKLLAMRPLPNVIISDISMPDEDGYSFIGKVRVLSIEEGGQIPAIALTAFASENDRIKSLQAGFQYHHTKPFEPDLLLENILAAIEK